MLQVRSPAGRPFSKEQWDEEYGRGRWSYLAGTGEACRYGVIGAYIRACRNGSRLLDLGCGQCLLHEHLGVGTYQYTGVDMSKQAVTLARSRLGDTANLIAADIESVELSGKFDVIIFNEVLYYLSDPLGTMDRFSALLSIGGCFVVSMNDPGEARPDWCHIVRGVWHALERSQWTIVEDCIVRNVTVGQAWRIAVVRPRTST
jgi:2-polyprenyl-3-methyl-5-hydroxy-6-metoxy-1,4-benzoquinol methylase